MVFVCEKIEICIEKAGNRINCADRRELMGYLNYTYCLIYHMRNSNKNQIKQKAYDCLNTTADNKPSAVTSNGVEGLQTRGCECISARERPKRETTK
jgi:hypothetical protein